MSDAIIKAATWALLEVEAVEDAGLDQDELARRVVAAVAPLIRAAVLEEAARMIEQDRYYPVKEQVATAVRALKERP